MEGFEKCEKAMRPISVVGAFIDVAKAFDSFPFTKLLKYLQVKYDMSNFLMRILESDLTLRTMQVKVNESLSNRAKTASGVPNGIILTMYINATSNMILSSVSMAMSIIHIV